MEVRFHNDDRELYQILELQARNSRNYISKEELLKEGFVTLQHTLEDLNIMCGNTGHTIAVEDGTVVGYALTMLSEYHYQVPALSEMVEKINKIEARENYLIMGQVCISKKWRGNDLFNILYNHIREQFRNRYYGIYTEIDEDNPRSIRAHERIGFKTIMKYQNIKGKTWNLVYWKWKK